MKKVKILIVDDSAVVRNILSGELGKFPDIEVAGTATDPYVARDKIIRTGPDVLILDIEMPRMDGVTFLRRLMSGRPMPVVVFSTLTPSGCDLAMQAMEAGALEVMHKPELDVASKLTEAMVMLHDKVIAAAQAKYKFVVKPKEVKSYSGEPLSIRTTDKVVVIGSSTGGTEAIRDIIPRLPPNFPGIVVAQHMPAHFTKTFAVSLDAQCPMEVREAADNDTVRPGLALIAPGNMHTLLCRSGARYHVRIKDGPLICHQRPSVEVLFDSAAKNAGLNAIGVILTGMGSDGAKGLLMMKNAGALTIAQDEKSCVVYGMPRAAVEMGAAQKVAPLENIAGILIGAVSARANP